MILPPVGWPDSAFAAEQRRAVGATVEADVDVAVAGHFHRRHACDGTDLFHQFRGDFLGRLAKLLGELERRRHRHFAEIALPRLLDGHRQIDAVADLNMGVKRLETCFSME